MRTTTPRANARAMPKSAKPETAIASILRTLADETRRLRSAPNDREALAAEFEAARIAERNVNRTDAEEKAAADRQAEILKKIAALPSRDTSTIRLKARAYMWGENAYDLEEFAGVQADAVSGPVLVSLFRDLGVDAPEAAVAGFSPPSAAALDLLELSDDLSLVVDLIDAACMASDSLPPHIVGRGPLTRLLNLTNDKLAAAIDKLDKVREART